MCRALPVNVEISRPPRDSVTDETDAPETKDNQIAQRSEQ
jgi:hypothetical protein